MPLWCGAFVVRLFLRFSKQWLSTNWQEVLLLDC